MGGPGTETALQSGAAGVGQAFPATAIDPNKEGIGRLQSPSHKKASSQYQAAPERTRGQLGELCQGKGNSMPKRITSILFMIVSLFSYYGLAQGAGLILYEINSPLTGTASAGWAALAEDASTAFTNPAGMTRLDRSQLLVGAQPLIVTT